MSKKRESYTTSKDYVATITINQPWAFNAFAGASIVEIERPMLTATADENVGEIVLAGAGHTVVGYRNDAFTEAVFGYFRETKISQRINDARDDQPRTRGRPSL